MVNESVSEWYVKEFEVSAIYHLKETSERTNKTKKKIENNFYRKSIF
jgi:hypothetical protein